MKVTDDKDYQNLRKAAHARGYVYTRSWRAEGDEIARKHVLRPLSENGESLFFGSEKAVLAWLIQNGYQPRQVPRAAGEED